MASCDNSTYVAHSTSSVTPTVYALGWVFLVLPILLSTGTLAFFSNEQPKHARTRVRPTILNASFVLGTWCMAFGTMLPVVTTLTQPCWVTTMFILLQIPLVDVFLLGRIVVVGFQYNFSKAALEDAEDRRNSDEKAAVKDAVKDTSSNNRIHSTGTAVTVASAPFHDDDVHSFKTTTTGPTYISALLLSISTLKTPPTDRESRRRVLTALKMTSSPRGLALISSFLLVPCAVVGAVAAASDPILRECTGCLWTGLVIYLAIALAGIIIPACLAIAWSLRSVPDTWGLRTELTLVLIAGGGLASVFVILTLLDPTQWAYLMAHEVVYMGTVMLINVWPVIVAKRWDVAVAGGGAENEAHAPGTISASVDAILSDPVKLKTFEEQLVKECAVESLLFLRDATDFARSFYDVQKQTRLVRAKKIVDLYLRPGSLLEVNVGWAVTNKAMTAVESREFGVQVFDEALAEVKLLLWTGAVQRFIKAANEKNNSAAQKGRRKGGA